ncbi:MAG TPA: hypothetical protein VKM55_08335 [Candidatus Lokiarchaeia archaeon]|nr:hypothetical protein [Candidatus Lokiarchaeia archaeon]
MIEAFYLVKDSGLPIYTYHQGDKNPKTFDDLIAPFLAAIDIFSRENFHGRIKAIVLEDGQKLYFRAFKLNSSDRTIRFIAITSSEFDNITALDSKMINLKWLMEKLGRYLDDGAMIPPAIETELIQKIKELIEMHTDSTSGGGTSDSRLRPGLSRTSKRF